MIVAAADGRVSFPFGIAGARERLAAPRTYYVRTDGSDANDGLSDSAGGAFATLQKAADVIFGTLDLGGHNVTVQVADGSYAEGARMEGAQVGRGRITFVGNASTPGNVIVTSATGYTFRADAGARFSVQSLEVRSTGGGCLLAVTDGAVIWFSNLRFGASLNDHARAGDQSSIVAEGNYAMVGSAPQHWGAAAGALRVQNRTVTLTGTPAFSSAFSNADVVSAMFINGNTFSGAATGKRYRGGQCGHADEWRGRPISREMWWGRRRREGSIFDARIQDRPLSPSTLHSPQ